MSASPKIDPASVIALDVMGGDHAPKEIVAGALRAIRPDRRHPLRVEQLLLVGDEAAVRAELAAQGGDPGFAILHAKDVIGMDEKPGVALRQKPDASIVRCVGAVKQGRAGAVVGMGNTGACVGAATLGLGVLEGVRRPGIAVTMDLVGKPLTIIDMGANAVPKPEHLLQYGQMGAIYAQNVLDQEQVRVGLLNIGEEEGKGTELTKAAFDLLTASSLRFVGNVEPREMLAGKADLIVTDGFTGNVVLKLMESLASVLMGLFAKELEAQRAPFTKLALGNLAKRLDYSEYGGALLLGVGGIVVIGHGRSDANAVANACVVAARALESGVNRQIVSGLRAG
jgi:glycerol-3-phosphate acyltransferase PlsX